MYCAFCGNRSTAVCHACARRVCRGHRLWWPTGRVCPECRPRLTKRAAVAGGWAVVGGLFLAVALALAAK